MISRRRINVISGKRKRNRKVFTKPNPELERLKEQQETQDKFTAAFLPRLARDEYDDEDLN